MGRGFPRGSVPWRIHELAVVLAAPCGSRIGEVEAPARIRSTAPQLLTPEGLAGRRAGMVTEEAWLFVISPEKSERPAIYLLILVAVFLYSVLRTKGGIMESIKSLLASCIIVVALATNLQTPQAADSGGGGIQHRAEKVRTIPFNGKLVSVSAQEMVFKLRGKEKSRVFHVSAETRIMKEGQKATLADMGDGDMIGGSAVQRVDGEFDAVSVRIGTKGGGASKEGKSKKPAAE